MKMRHPRILSLASIMLMLLGLLSACTPGGSQSADATGNNEGGSFSIAVYVTGVTQGSPTFEMMVAGVEEAVGELKLTMPDVSLKIIEGGYNQGEWQNGITALAATGLYDLIVTSNPSMPAYCQEVALAFPNQKFLILDATLEGNPQIKTVAFNQYQQAWLNGYMAGLITTSEMEHANQDLIIGLLAGQEYPVMNNEIRVGFLDGARAVNANISLDFRVLGNWQDAAKAEAIARDMIEKKADIILTIAGSANQGVVNAARNVGAYVGWFDTSAYSQAPGIIVASSIIRLNQAAKNSVIMAGKGTLEFGKADILGIAEGAVSFDAVSPDFVANVPGELAEKQQELLESFISGSVAPPQK